MIAFMLATLSFAAPTHPSVLPNPPVMGPVAPVAIAHTPVAEQAPATGELLVDAKVPAELQIDGLVVGQLFVASRLNLTLPAGERRLAVTREGNAEELVVNVPADGSAIVIIGKTGTSVGKPSDLPDPPTVTGPVKLEVRVEGDAIMQLRLGRSRFEVVPGQLLSLEMARGPHAISVRSSDGTIVWANGTLELRGGEMAVLQLAEGRMPELTGDARLVTHKN